MKRCALTILGTTAVAALAALSLTAATATASISGPCTATLAGVDVASRGTGPTDKPITVAHDASVPITLTAKGTLTHIHFTMEFAGFSWTVKDKDVNDPTYTDTVKVKTYAKYGVGLYRVNGAGSGAGFACSGSALVKVKGNPLASIAGIAGLVATLLGVGGILAGGLGGRGGFKVSRAFMSTLAGALGGIGAIILLQQAGIVYPTLAVAIAGLVVGALLGMGAASASLLTGDRGAKP